MYCGLNFQFSLRTELLANPRSIAKAAILNRLWSMCFWFFPVPHVVERDVSRTFTKSTVCKRAAQRVSCEQILNVPCLFQQVVPVVRHTHD